MTVGYLNATINRKAREWEPEIGTDKSIQIRHNPLVDRYGYWFGLQRSCGSGFWTVLEPNRTISAVQSQTASGLPEPVANTWWERLHPYVRLWFPGYKSYITTFYLWCGLRHLWFCTDNIKHVHPLSKCCLCRSRSKLIHWRLNNSRKCQCGCPVALIILLMQDETLSISHWYSSSGCSRERVCSFSL